MCSYLMCHILCVSYVPHLMCIFLCVSYVPHLMCILCATSYVALNSLNNFHALSAPVHTPNQFMKSMAPYNTSLGVWFERVFYILAYIYFIHRLICLSVLSFSSHRLWLQAESFPRTARPLPAPSLFRSPLQVWHRTPVARPFQGGVWWLPFQKAF